MSMYGPMIDLLRAEYARRWPGPIPPPEELVWAPWVGPFLHTLDAAAPPAIPALFMRWLDGGLGLRPRALWRLTAPVLGHAAGAVVATEVLTTAGYAVVEPERTP